MASITGAVPVISSYSDTNTKCPPNTSPPNISPTEYKPKKMCFKMSISPGLIFGILRYVKNISNLFMKVVMLTFERFYTNNAQQHILIINFLLQVTGNASSRQEEELLNLLPEMEMLHSVSIIIKCFYF